MKIAFGSRISSCGAILGSLSPASDAHLVRIDPWSKPLVIKRKKGGGGNEKESGKRNKKKRWGPTSGRGKR